MRSRHYDYEEIHRLHAGGMPIPDIAKRMRCARSTVWRVLHGSQLATSTHAKRVDRAVLLDLWQRGLTLIEIGAAIGCASSTVGSLVKQHKLPPRAPLQKLPQDDPTPEEIAERARECRERHYAERRREAVCSTTSKLSKWRHGICQPRGLA